MSPLIPLNILIPIALVIIILIVVMWYLYSKNKKIAGKLISEKIRFNKYKKGVEHLKNHPAEPEKDFISLNKYTRAFFKEYLNLNYSLTYLELADSFKKQNKPEHEKFCRLMSDISYKGKKTRPKEIRQLVDMFSEILKSS